MGGSDPIISGSAMAVFLGFSSAVSALIVSELAASTRTILFLAGVVVLAIGLLTSSG